MRNTQGWAAEQWRTTLKTKLRGDQLEPNRWRSMVKEQQGTFQEGTDPPFQREDGSVVQTARDKANLLARHFSKKMGISD